MEVIPNFLAKRASLTPGRIALETEREKVTFMQLHRRSLALAERLTTIGVTKGDAVSIFMKNSVPLVALLFALKHIGAITVLHNLRLTPKELSFQIADAESKYLLADEENKGGLISSTAIGMDNILTMNELEKVESLPLKYQQEFDVDAIDTIMYTSGTTGFPKGVKQTYGNHFWSAAGSALNLGLHMNDCWLLAVPIFHISGLSILMRSVIYGMRVVLHEKFNAPKVNSDLKEKGVTIVSVVSVMLSEMLEDLGEASYPPSFRCMLTGGGPVPLPLLEKCHRKSIPVYQTYGMTETCSQIVTLSPDFALQKIGSAGKPLFPCQLKIVEGESEVSAPSVGEIVVKGPNVTPGYYNREEATENTIRNGWLYTGDVGYVDEDGFLFVLDRRSDLIISGGENIYPAEIESALLAHPAILEAGVTGIADDKWGQVPIAFVVSTDISLSESDLIMFVEQMVAKYKVPKQVKFVDSLPRNAANKLIRRKLVEHCLSSSAEEDQE